MTIYIYISFSVVHYNSLLKICKLLGNRAVFHTAPNRVLCVWEDTQVLFLNEWYQEKVRTFLLMERETKQKDPISSLSDLLLHPDAQPLSNMSPPPQHTSLHPSPVSIRSPSPGLHLPTTQKVNPLLSLIFHRTVLNFNCGGGYTTLCLSKSICNF